MNALRAVGRLLVVVAPSIIFAACSSTQAPNKWTLWYTPNEPKPGTFVAHFKPCNTYVFASSPDQSTYVVGLVDGWTGPRHPRGNSATIQTGESYARALELGTGTVRDENNGYDLKVDIVYDVAAYLPAKARADTDCSTPAHTVARLTIPRAP